MPLINLIREQREERRAASRKVKLLGGLAVALLALGAVGSIVLFGIGGAYAIQAANAQAEIEELAPIREELDEAEARLARLEPRLRALEDAQEGTDRWRRILAYLKTDLPTEIFLNRVDTTPASGDLPTQIRFQGIAASQERVGALILRLQLCEDLDNVSLSFTRERANNEGVGIDFEVSASVVGTEPPPPPIEPTEGSEA